MHFTKDASAIFTFSTRDTGPFDMPAFPRLRS